MYDDFQWESQAGSAMGAYFSRYRKTLNLDWKDLKAHNFNIKFLHSCNSAFLLSSI